VFQTVFPSIIRNSKLHIRAYSVRYLSDRYCYLLLAWLARLAVLV